MGELIVRWLARVILVIFGLVWVLLTWDVWLSLFAPVLLMVTLYGLLRAAGWLRG